MRDLLTLFATASGETLLAIAEDRLGADVRDAAQSNGGGIAVLPLIGGLSARGLTLFGRQVLPGMNTFRAQLSGAVADPNVGAIVLDVNSPGGTYAGTPETANAVRQAAEVKPVIAVVDTMAASAAYFIAAQASEIVVTPSGEVGSLGVLSVHLDFSKALEMDGVTPTIIRSRPSKADANPLEPLTDEAKAAIQASVMEADTEFLKAVAKGRGKTLAEVRQLADEAGAGRLVSAKRAVEMGLADRIATMPEVLSGLIRPRRAAAQRRASFAF